MVELLVRYTNINIRAGQMTRALALYERSWPAREAPITVPSRQIRHRISAEQIEELLAAYQNGKTSTALASQYGIAKSTVLTLLRKHGASVRFPPITGDELAQIVALHHAGVRQVDIATQIGRSKSAVWHALMRAGQLRNRW